MQTVYMIGLVCGGMVLYLLCSLGIGWLGNILNGDDDTLFMFIVAYIVGAAAFLLIYINYLDARGLNNLPTTAIEQTEEVTEE